jgi:hypothetical protein
VKFGQGALYREVVSVSKLAIATARYISNEVSPRLSRPIFKRAGNIAPNCTASDTFAGAFINDVVKAP